MRIFVADFETTVFDGQDFTEVWAGALVEIYSEDVVIFHSIKEMFDFLKNLSGSVTVYFHNLKFDGAFWLSYLIQIEKMEQAAIINYDNKDDFEWIPNKQMKNNTFKYVISSLGQWYKIQIKTRNKMIELRDSLKLLPFSVKAIGESFKTKHRKLDMVYEGFRYAGCEITEEEQEYIKNDVLVVKEALEIMFEQGHSKLTIGSCCLAEFKSLITPFVYKTYFPNLTEHELQYEYEAIHADEYIRRSYRGGWCYVVPEKAGMIIKNGFTADVNSLYPSMMSSESGNIFPVGQPTFWKGNFIPDEATKPDKYYFVRLRTRFHLKEGKLPFIQMKGTLNYQHNVMLTTSDVYNPEDGLYYDHYYEKGEKKKATVELTLTQTDYILFLEHYNVTDFEILDGCYFKGVIGIFDTYIEKYKKIKLESKGAIKQIAKLFLNNLYGKMGSSTISDFRVAQARPDGSIGFFQVRANDKTPGYIPVGSAITSYARNFTIRAAQKNYHPGARGFVYADTDSIHCDMPIENVEGIKIHEKNFCCWKIESEWNEAKFLRQKTYLEHVIKENGEVCKPYHLIKCAGMPERAKELFRMSLDGEKIEKDDKNYTEEEKEFVNLKRDYTNFEIGLTIPGALKQRTIPGGVVLIPSFFKLRPVHRKKG